MILIVEDDTAIASFLSLVVEKAGQRAIVEHDSVAAVASWVNDARVTAVLADYNLNGALTGAEVLQAWQEVRPEVRRVLVTAHPKDAIIMDGLANGSIEAMLEKPPRLADLRAALQLTSRGVSGR